VSAGAELGGHTAVVIGACGGVGTAICDVLAGAGANVAVADLDAQAVERLASHHSGVSGAFDASDGSAMGSFASQVVERLGVPDVVVNCLGLWHSGDYHALTDEDWHAVIGANLTPVFHAARAFLPAMQERGSGSMVNFASTAGEYGSIRPAAHYAAAKGGVIAISKSLAREVSPDGVRVNVISPGPLATKMLQPGADGTQASVASRTLFGRLGTPADIAAAVLYLASPGSAWVTGEVLRVNGGSLL
jgi:NAD(P)-dependent dehydrogenase (short-subunit alcohol dehydrogenase family)